MNGIPRRIRLDLSTPGELAIRAAVGIVESMGADVRLTDAVVLLGAARERVADYVDNVAGLRTHAVQEKVGVDRHVLEGQSGVAIVDIPRHTLPLPEALRVETRAVKDQRKTWSVWIVRGVQSFELGYRGTAVEAGWYAKMLRSALQIPEPE